MIRGIKIGAMHRENRIWLKTEADPYIDPAIELLAPLADWRNHNSHCGRLGGYRIIAWGAEKQKKG